MKKLIAYLIILTVIFAFAGCGGKTSDYTADVKKTPVPQETVPVSSNPISDPITKSNLESALSDARNCLSILALSLAEEGVGSLDDGIIFVVEKGNAEYLFVYGNGELENVDNAVRGAEITPDNPDWLENVRAYMP